MVSIYLPDGKELVSLMLAGVGHLFLIELDPMVPLTSPSCGDVICDLNTDWMSEAH